MHYITEEEVDRNLSVKDVIEELRNAFLSYGSGRSKSSPRDRIFGDGMVLNTMPALYADRHMAGLKTYIAGKGGAPGSLCSYSTLIRWN